MSLDEISTPFLCPHLQDKRRALASAVWSAVAVVAAYALLLTNGGRGWGAHSRTRARPQGTWHLLLLLMIGWLAECSAGEGDDGERSMLFNTRGLAVSSAVATVWALAITSRRRH